MVLEKEKLFGKLNKCTFFSNDMTFLGYIVTSHDIKADESKVEAIRTWLIPQSIHYVQSFHGLAFIYKQFTRNFSTIMAPMTDVIKVTSFIWTPKAQFAVE